ncbi:MAG: nicotinate phosphoribosyltransferase [bacterium]|nr:nicotinate phosphoribosyltransferase [bacterium]
MKHTKTKYAALPQSHHPYTDKYFLRTNEILKKEKLNPRVSIKVFCRGKGPVAGLEEAVEIIKTYSNLQKGKGEVWISRKEHYSNNEPLMIIKAPVQEIVELETMYLGVMSAAISQASGLEKPSPLQIKSKLRRLKAIYGPIPIIYFGARHYHWSMDKEIAAAALEGGAVQTSTDIGSSNIGQQGVGTTPHLLTIILASIYGKENATLKTAQLFDKHMPAEIPRVTLVDTFNREITDSLAVARYFGKRKHAFRLDTCGENIGEGSTLYKGQKTRDPQYKTGTGVTVELAANLRNRLIREGYGENTGIFLSSGFGNENKAGAFVEANSEFIKAKGLTAISGVGIGEVSGARFCTADIFEVDGKPLAKTGRETGKIDVSIMKQII